MVAPTNNINQFETLKALKAAVKSATPEMGKIGGRSFIIEKEEGGVIRFKMKDLIRHVADLVQKNIDKGNLPESPKGKEHEEEDDLLHLPKTLLAVRKLDKEGFEEQINDETNPLRKILHLVKQFFGNITFDKNGMLNLIQVKGKRGIEANPDVQAKLEKKWPTKESVQKSIDEKQSFLEGLIKDVRGLNKRSEDLNKQIEDLNKQL